MGLKASGFRALSDDLARISEGFSREAMERAIRSGAEPVLDKMIQYAPVKRGIVKKALKIGPLKRWHGGKYYMRVGVVHGPDAPHAHLVEDGHGGPHPAPPHPFARPAFDSTKDVAFSNIRQSFIDEME
jgi:HK97 gp10 family phage protein